MIKLQSAINQMSCHGRNIHGSNADMDYVLAARQPIAFVLLLGDYCGSLFAVNAFCRIDMRVLQSPGKNAVI